MLSALEEVTQQEKKYLNDSFVKKAFPLATVWMLLIHIALFGLILPLYYYLIGVTLAMLSLRYTFKAGFSKKRAWKLALLALAAQLIFFLFSPFSLVLQALAAGWTSSLLIGLWAQYFAGKEERAYVHMLRSKENNYLDALKQLREKIQEKERGILEHKRQSGDESVEKQEQIRELNKLLSYKEKEIEKFYQDKQSFTSLAKSDREDLIVLRGELTEKRSSEKSSLAHITSLRRAVQKLQQKVNYYRVEHFHRGAMFDLYNQQKTLPTMDNITLPKKTVRPLKTEQSKK
ncbi:hypothetical protein COB21_02120 [Candidatus Aerophobetes bacterium]|uniref:Uncharacterized protein n=1 Tax=Aerophobetes bacterium TaxID=2030807 RepID=A0A2A4X5S2_UNCAE|nr:MAG: hypothetical protein COB21_02120 [Candidatus Aerophobetes bacterium]